MKTSAWISTVDQTVKASAVKVNKKKMHQKLPDLQCRIVTEKAHYYK